MKQRFLLKMVLVAAGLFMGLNGAWAYTPALTNSYEVAGYKLKAYYNIANTNVDNMCPTEGDLRFRGGGYGLFNFASGNRGANVTISVAATDLLIVEFKDSQNRSVTVNSVSNSTKNATFTSGDFLAFNVNTDATSLNFNIGRGGCIIAMLVLEKDKSAETANYSITYKFGEETIATDAGEDIAVGTVINVANVKWYNDVKYILKDGEPTSLTIASGDNNITVEMREASTFTYTVNEKSGENVFRTTSGSYFEGETVVVPYRFYNLLNGTLYTKGATKSEYREQVNLSEDNKVVDLDYSATEISDVVFLTEGEDIEGVNKFVTGNSQIRSSNAGSAYSSTDVAITTLGIGKYKLTGVACIASGTGNFIFKVGNRVIYTLHGEKNNWITGDCEFVVAKNSTITFVGGSSSQGLDFIYIQSLGEPTPEEIAEAEAADYLADNVFATIGTAGYATFASTKAIDLANLPEGVTAYKAVSVDASTITFESLDQTVPANTGILLKGTAGEVAIPVAASGTAVDDNLLEVNTTGEVFDAEAGYSYYGLQKNQKTFAQFDPATVAIPANKAYLKVATADARELAISFGEGDVTGIEKVESAAKNAGVVYNLAGQRVALPTKGLYIVNGKKAIVK